MLNQFVSALIIKYSPVAVGILLTWLASTLHVVIDPSSQAGLVALTVAILTALYAMLAKLAVKFVPWLAPFVSSALRLAK